MRTPTDEGGDMSERSIEREGGAAETGAETVGDLHLPEAESEAVKGGATPSDLSITKTIDKSSPQRYADVPPSNP
jgi:hypothetical protein